MAARHRNSPLLISRLFILIGNYEGASNDEKQTKKFRNVRKRFSTASFAVASEATGVKI